MMTSEELYSKAYELHYNESNFQEALKIYNQIIVQFPDSQEASYAKTQIANIEKLPPDKLEGKISPSLREPSTKIMLTTASSVEGYEVTKTIEIITAECVFGINFFRDFFTALSDVFGGRSETAQNTLREARKICLAELKKEAFRLSADAVIAVKLDYSEFSGKGKSMLFLVASGTAVNIKKVKQQVLAATDI